MMQRGGSVEGDLESRLLLRLCEPGMIKSSSQKILPTRPIGAS